MTMDESTLHQMVTNMIVEFSDEALVGDKYAWGQRYGGPKINKLVGEFKEELSKKREVEHVIPIRMTQNTVFDYYPKERTIITMEETIITHRDGGSKLYEKGSPVNLPAKPPKISAPNGKKFVNMVLVVWK